MIISFSSENFKFMFLVNFIVYYSPVYVRPDQPPILALIKGSPLLNISVDVASLSLISLRLIDLHTTFFTFIVNVISPKFYS